MSMSDAIGDVVVDIVVADALPTPSPPPSDPAPSPSPPVPSSLLSLTASAQLLYSDQQRERGETTDDGVSPYLLKRRKFYSAEQWQLLLAQLAATRTVYVGNLSFYTTEAQLVSSFAQVGRVVRLVMGLNERSMTPCGFCFVEFASHEEALNCQRHLSGLMADERTISADLDPGFEEGRQFGRSKLTGGQIRDDHRKDFDPGRGGYVLRQATTFTSLTPGVLSIRPTRSRKKQKIDLAAVRASRQQRARGGDGEERKGEAEGAQPALVQVAPAAADAAKERVGSKRRRDRDEDDEDARERAEEEAEEEDEGDAAVDEAADLEERAGDGEDTVDEVVTSGAEGDVESAADVDGEGDGGGRRRMEAADSQPQQPPSTA